MTKDASAPYACDGAAIGDIRSAETRAKMRSTSSSRDESVARGVAKDVFALLSNEQTKC